MGGSFSSSSSSSKSSSKQPQRRNVTISQVDRAVLDLKNTRDALTKYRRKLELDEAKIVQRAKEAKNKGDTKTALNLLRLKKFKHQQMDQVNNQLLTVLQMVETIEGKQNEAQVLDAIQNGKDSLAKLHEENSLEKVLDLMDTVQEQAELEQEISNVLAGVPELDSAAEEEVLAELEALEKSMKAETTPMELPNVPTTELPTPLPNVPTTELPVPQKAESASKSGRVAVPS